LTKKARIYCLSLFLFLKQEASTSYSVGDECDDNIVTEVGCQHAATDISIDRCCRWHDDLFDDEDVQEEASPPVISDHYKVKPHHCHCFYTNPDHEKGVNYTVILYKNEKDGKIIIDGLRDNEKEIKDISGYTFVLTDINNGKKILPVANDDFPVIFENLDKSNYKIEVFNEEGESICFKRFVFNSRKKVIITQEEKEEEKPAFVRWVLVDIKNLNKTEFIWVGVSIEKGYIEKGSKFHVRAIDKFTDPVLFSQYFKDYDGDFDPEHMVFYELKIIKPDGSEYSKLGTKAKIYVQVPKGWDEGDLKAVFISEEKDEQFMESYINVPKRGRCLVYETTHFSPYAIIDKADKQIGDSETTDISVSNSTESKNTYLPESLKNFRQNDISEDLNNLQDDISEGLNDLLTNFQENLNESLENILKDLKDNNKNNNRENHVIKKQGFDSPQTDDHFVEKSALGLTAFASACGIFYLSIKKMKKTAKHLRDDSQDLNKTFSPEENADEKKFNLLATGKRYVAKHYA